MKNSLSFEFLFTGDYVFYCLASLRPNSDTTVQANLHLHEQISSADFIRTLCGIRHCSLSRDEKLTPCSFGAFFFMVDSQEKKEVACAQHKKRWLYWLLYAELLETLRI